MKSIIAALTAALAFVLGNKKTVDDLKQQIADRDKIIADLHAAIEANTANDAALEQAVTDAKAAQKTAEEALATTTADIADAEAKAAELSASITADPAIPIRVDPETGTVTETIPA